MILEHRPMNLQLRHVFTISRGSASTAENILVELRDGDLIGRGEATPYSPLGITPETNREGLEAMRQALEELPVDWNLQAALNIPAARLDRGEWRAACCAVDVALHDLWGKKLRQPLWKCWGLEPAKVPRSSYTIGIDSIPTMLEKAGEAADQRIFKIKLGTDRDLEIIQVLRGAFPRHTIRVDANAAWDEETAIAMSAELEEYEIEFIEQPLPVELDAGMPRVKRKSGIPLVADESCVLPADVPGLQAGFHGVNVKLVKCGGLSGARRIIETARSLGLKVMLGCMLESSVLIGAAYQLAPLADWLDLDGNVLIDDDPFYFAPNHSGEVKLSSNPGIGVIPADDERCREQGK